MSAVVPPLNASPITVSKGTSDRLTSRPAIENAVLRASISRLSGIDPEAYSSVRLALAPTTMPAPHWPAPAPGRLQVLTPPGLTVQPLSANSLRAASGSYGSGLTASVASAKVFAGLIGTGP